jgi:hypothetical protein
MLQLYDLHVGKVGEHHNSRDGCPREDEVCGLIGENLNKGGKCGAKGICIGNMVNQRPRCICRPGWRGHRCSSGAFLLY